MKKDLVDYTYLSDNGRYADLLNGTLFDAEQVGRIRKQNRNAKDLTSGEFL